MPEVAIVGGGLSGLALAFRMHRLRPDARLTILEKESRAGGKIWTDRQCGFQVETGPNGFLDSKRSTWQLCHDLGLGGQLIPASEGSRQNRYLFWNGKLRALPGSFWSFVTNDLLSWRGKLNLLFEKYRAPPTSGPADESVYDFARRRAGRETADIFADAMVTGIHAGDPKLLSVAAAFPRLPKFEKEAGSVLRGFTRAGRERRQEAQARGEQPHPPRMWSFRPGLRLLIETLREQCGAEIVTGTAIKRVRQEQRWVVETEGRDRWEADAVVLAAPAPAQAEQVADLDAGLGDMLAQIQYASIAVVALGFRQADTPGNLDGFGYIAPQSMRRDLLGVQWCSSIFPDRAPDGMVLWRALCGGWNRGDISNWDDEKLIAAVRAELELAQNVKAAPAFAEVIRWPQAIPQYLLGHLDRVRRIEERVGSYPGLFLAGNAFHGVAMNDCTEQAELLARRIAAFI